MSQKVFKIDDQTACRVGWDPPLETFFGQVYTVDADGEQCDGDDGAPNTILWVGTKPGEIRTVDELARLLQPHAVLPEDIRNELFAVEVD